MTHTIVRPITAADRAAWFDMWSGYCAFYGTYLPASVSECTWQRIVADASGVGALIAVCGDRGEARGFANYIVHPYTWSERPACYLEDLFVRRGQRGNGVGRALMEHLLALARQSGWSRVYWMTRESNGVARRLYDLLAERDDFIRYVVEINAGSTPPDGSPGKARAADLAG